MSFQPTNDNQIKGAGNKSAPTKTDKLKNKLKQDKRQHDLLKFPSNIETEGTKNMFMININAISGSKFNGQVYQTVEGGDDKVVYQQGESNSLARKYTGNYVRTSTSIALYMPESVQTDYAANWGSEDLGSTGAVMDAWTSTGDLTDFNTWGKAWDESIKDNAGEVAKMMAIRGLNAATPFAIKDAYQVANAVVENPYTEVLFRRVDNRTFQYTFKLIPASPEEQMTIKKIVDTLKFHRAPEKKLTNANIYWSYPSTFDLQFLKKDGNENEWLYKHSTCAMTDFSVRQGGDGYYASYADGSPFFTTISMSFLELEVLDKERLLDGF